MRFRANFEEIFQIAYPNGKIFNGTSQHTYLLMIEAISIFSKDKIKNFEIMPPLSNKYIIGTNAVHRYPRQITHFQKNEKSSNETSRT